MSLDEQIQVLIDDAPADGVTPVMVNAISPALKLLAQRLRHLQYYIVQTLEQDWALSILNNQAEPGTKKTVIYAFPSLKDVASGPYPMQDPQLIALPLPVTHILFQMLAMESIDGIIFFEMPGNLSTGIEIQREELNTLIQGYLNQAQPPTQLIPPDIA
jgi:hypothetical protein